LLVPEADFRELADESRAPVVDSPSPVAGFHALAADSPWQADETLAPAADSHEPEVELLVPAADFRARVAALADSAVVHSHAPEAGSLRWAGELAVDSPAQVADSLARADERGVELPVPAADFRAWVAAWGSAAALADSAVVHSHAPEADFRELAAPSGSPELARSRALAVDCRVPLVSRVVLRSAYSAALPPAFLLTVAAADSPPVLRLCWPAALERASHSSQCETRSASVLSAQRELLEPTEPSSLRLVCSQAFPGDAPTVSQEH
jgi:hypothetical protein